MARLNLSRHWKFRRLARALGSPVMARGVLELLWETAYEVAGDYIGTPADIADALAWPQDPAALIDALVDAQFLELRGGELRVHDLWDHAPRYVRLRWTRAHPKQIPPWRAERAPAPNLEPDTADDRTPPRRTDPRNPTPIADRPAHPCTDLGSSVPRSRTYPPRPAPSKERKSSGARAPRSPVDPCGNVENVRVLVKLAYELGERFTTDADLKEALKRAAARLGIAYDADTIGRVIDALTRARAPLWATTSRPAASRKRRIS